jgi:hypothetical protein
MMKSSARRLISIVASLLVLAGCATAPPVQQNDICQIFYEKSGWYEDARDMERRWGTPIELAMAFIKYESSFRHDAMPPKYYVLGFIPWGRVSSAYGYSQALDGTWDDFEEKTEYGGSRTNFDDSLMFIGWYTNESSRVLGISKHDAYNQYLAYHEGRGGFQRRTYAAKPSLVKLAHRVASQTQQFGFQLNRCRASLEAQL